MATFEETKFENVVTKVTEGSNTQPRMFGILPENSKLMWDSVPFEAFGRIMRTTNRDIALAIKLLYEKTFHDLRGVYISWDGKQFITELFFAKNMAPKPDNKIENLIDVTTRTSGQSLFDLKQIIDNKASGKKYILNDETKLLLSDIVYGGEQNGKPDNRKIWNDRTVMPIRVPSGDPFYNPNACQIVLRVTGIFDFHRILTKLFGSRMVIKTEVVNDPSSNKPKMQNISADAAYEARYIKPVINEPYVFIMNIEQFSKAKVESIIMQENPVRPLYANGIMCF